MNWNSKAGKMLVQATLSLDTESDVKIFFRDLMTEGELSSFVKRLQAAQMLSEKVSYTQIEKETGLSSATVARVAKWLNSGKGGYTRILNKIHHHNNFTTPKTGRGLS